MTYWCHTFQMNLCSTIFNCLSPYHICLVDGKGFTLLFSYVCTGVGGTHRHRWHRVLSLSQQWWWGAGQGQRDWSPAASIAVSSLALECWCQLYPSDFLICPSPKICKKIKFFKKSNKLYIYNFPNARCSWIKVKG